MHAGAVHLLLDASLFEEATLLRFEETGDEHVELVDHRDGDVGCRLGRARVHHVLVLLGAHVGAGVGACLTGRQMNCVKAVR